eukprot:UN32150
MQGLSVHLNTDWLQKQPDKSFGDAFNHVALDKTWLDKPPSTYYEVNPPLPLFRNHEALTTLDPRNMSQVDKVEELESETKSLLRVNLKPEKIPQLRDGVSYSPNFDFDLWGIDYFRPRTPMNPQDWGNRWMVQKPVQPKMKRKTLPMRVRKRQDQFAPKWEKLIEFRYKTSIQKHRWKPWRKPNFICMKILGNGRGCAGFGIGKATSFDEAAQRATYEASHNMMYIPRYRNRTIAAPINGKMNNLRVRIEPRRVGDGGAGYACYTSYMYCVWSS